MNCVTRQIGGVLSLLLALTFAGAAQANVRALTDGCFAAFEAGSASAFPAKIKQVNKGPDQYLQGYKIDLGRVSVSMVFNADPSNPINFYCGVEGVEKSDFFKAKRISVGWPEAEAQVQSVFRRYAKKPGFKVVNGRLKEDSLGVDGLSLVKCSEPSVFMTFGPARLSDAGFVQPPFSLGALQASTFSVAMTAPLSVPQRQKHCR